MQWWSNDNIQATNWYKYLYLLVPFIINFSLDKHYSKTLEHHFAIKTSNAITKWCNIFIKYRNILTYVLLEYLFGNWTAGKVITCNHIFSRWIFHKTVFSRAHPSRGLRKELSNVTLYVNTMSKFKFECRLRVCEVVFRLLIKSKLICIKINDFLKVWSTGNDEKEVKQLWISYYTKINYVGVTEGLNES